MPSTCSACFMNRGAALGPTRWAHTIGFDAPRSKGWRKPSTVLDCYTATAEECRGIGRKQPCGFAGPPIKDMWKPKNNSSSL